MAVIDPVKVIITNYPEGIEYLLIIIQMKILNKKVAFKSYILSVKIYKAANKHYKRLLLAELDISHTY